MFTDAMVELTCRNRVETIPLRPFMAINRLTGVGMDWKESRTWLQPKTVEHMLFALTYAHDELVAPLHENMDEGGELVLEMVGLNKEPEVQLAQPDWYPHLLKVITFLRSAEHEVRIVVR